MPRDKKRQRRRKVFDDIPGEGDPASAGGGAVPEEE